MAFKEQLIRRRKQLGLSQERLGYRVGVTRQTVSKWELGETTPEMDKLIQLSRLFGCSIDELVENSPAEKSDGPESAGPRPWVGPWQYEYKSDCTLLGLPLVHIHVGHGLCEAKGIFAVGNVARGIFALGGLSAGVVALGGISFGLISLGGFALGLLFALGGLSIGTIAVGGFALGVLAFGGGAIGVYAVGGGALAGRVAAGGLACGPVAIGDQTRGIVCLSIKEATPEAVRQAILTQFPDTWPLLLALFSAVF